MNTIVVLLTLLVAAATGAADGESSRTLADLSIEQLMNESVTSVSKKETKLNQSPAAISVITQEDIRRSGALTIPDLLRMTPGLEVAQVDANKWAISSRGFNGLYANKLDDRHQEFGTSTGAQSTQIERSVYGKMTYRF